MDGHDKHSALYLLVAPVVGADRTLLRSKHTHRAPSSEVHRIQFLEGS